MFAALRKLFTRNKKPRPYPGAGGGGGGGVTRGIGLLDPRGPNKFEPGTTAPHPQYPAPPGETEYGTYQNPNKKKRRN